MRWDREQSRTRDAITFYVAFVFFAPNWFGRQERQWRLKCDWRWWSFIDHFRHSARQVACSLLFWQFTFSFFWRHKGWAFIDAFFQDRCCFLKSDHLVAKLFIRISKPTWIVSMRVWCLSNKCAKDSFSSPATWCWNKWTRTCFSLRQSLYLSASKQKEEKRREDCKRLWLWLLTQVVLFQISDRKKRFLDWIAAQQERFLSVVNVRRRACFVEPPNNENMQVSDVRRQIGPGLYSISPSLVTTKLSSPSLRSRVARARKMTNTLFN